MAKYRCATCPPSYDALDGYLDAEGLNHVVVRKSTLILAECETCASHQIKVWGTLEELGIFRQLMAEGRIFPVPVELIQGNPLPLPAPPQPKKEKPPKPDALWGKDIKQTTQGSMPQVAQHSPEASKEFQEAVLEMLKIVSPGADVANLAFYNTMIATQESQGRFPPMLTRIRYPKKQIENVANMGIPGTEESLAAALNEDLPNATQ